MHNAKAIKPKVKHLHNESLDERRVKQRLEDKLNKVVETKVHNKLHKNIVKKKVVDTGIKQRANSTRMLAFYGRRGIRISANLIPVEGSRYHRWHC